MSAGGCLRRPLPGMGGKLPPPPNFAPFPSPFQSCTRRPAKGGFFDYVTPIFIGNTKRIDLWSKKMPPITPRLAGRWSFDYVPANGFGGGVNSGPWGVVRVVLCGRMKARVWFGGHGWPHGPEKSGVAPIQSGFYSHPLSPASQEENVGTD